MGPRTKYIMVRVQPWREPHHCTVQYMVYNEWNEVNSHLHLGQLLDAFVQSDIGIISRSHTDDRCCHARCQLLVRSSLGFSILQLGGARIRTSDLPITRRPALPPELQPLQQLHIRSSGYKEFPLIHTVCIFLE